MKNKIIVFSSLAITALMFATPVFAAAAKSGEDLDSGKFIQRKHKTY